MSGHCPRGVTGCDCGAEYCNNRKRKVDPRDPDHSRPAPFNYHNCWKCQSGKKPCVNGRPHGCEYLHARDD